MTTNFTRLRSWFGLQVMAHMFISCKQTYQCLVSWLQTHRTGQAEPGTPQTTAAVGISDRSLCCDICLERCHIEMQGLEGMHVARHLSYLMRTESVAAAFVKP